MLTSRAEYRLLLRHDNADLRLTEIGYEIGLIPEERYQRFLKKKKEIEQEIKRLRGTRVKPNPEIQAILEEANSTPLHQVTDLAHLLKRPEIHYTHIERIAPSTTKISLEVAEQVEIQLKYEGYIRKSLQQVEKMKRMENKRIPAWVDYDQITGISSEAREKLKEVQPLSLGQALRISGVNPADISILMVHIEQDGKVYRSN